MVKPSLLLSCWFKGFAKMRFAVFKQVSFRFGGERLAGDGSGSWRAAGVGFEGGRNGVGSSGGRAGFGLG